MHIEFMYKTSGSNTGNCPAMNRGEGGYVVQGKITAHSEIVWTPADVVDRLSAELGLDLAALPVFQALDDGYLVRGTPIADEDRSQLRDLDTDETAVFVPDEAIAKAPVLA